MVEELRLQLYQVDKISEITDVNYFQKKLYRALNVPETRIQGETGFSMGRSSEILRDEDQVLQVCWKNEKRDSQICLATC